MHLKFFMVLFAVVFGVAKANDGPGEFNGAFQKKKIATIHQNEALRLAAYHGQFDLVKHAVEGNHLHFDPKHQQVHGPTAPVANHNNIIYNRNYQDPWTTGYTALHAAAISGSFKIVDLLLEHGWDPDKTSNEGVKPSEIARRGRNTELSAYLKTKEAPATTNPNDL